MLKKSISELGTKKTLTSLIIVVNAFIWYYAILHFLEEATKSFPGLSVSSITIWGFHFSGLILSALVGALTAKKIERNKFLIVWMTLGVISSFALMAVDTSNVILTSLIGLLLGVSLGIGMPTCMNYFSDTSSVENRGRLSGIALLASGIGIVALSIISINNAIILGIVLAVWRMSGLLIFLVMKSSVKIVPKRNVTYKEILSQRSFILYFVPWTMFSLINYLVAPISPTSTSNIPGSISLVGLVFLGIFAGIGGFLIDSLGRKFVAIFGFVMLGVGSALLGISIKNPYILYFNAIASGTAWGLLLVLFILTIWGDLSYISTSDKFYAIGASPFFLSAFLGVTVGTYILNLLPNSPQLFSFGAFFLFLAVLPLLYAPETLNEKTIMARQFKTYIEKAQKIAQEENLKNDNQDKEETEKADEEAKQVIQESPEYEDAQKLAEKYY
jgi:MFS family permease